MSHTPGPWSIDPGSGAVMQVEIDPLPECCVATNALLAKLDGV